MERKVVRDFGGREIEISTGKIAKQAAGSVVVRYGETVVLVTVCKSKRPKVGLDFVPLTIEYSEKGYAAGKIPGGFFKREVGRPPEHATLIARMIDRPIRPLFPKGYRYETQVIATVLSYDKINEPGIAALIGASAAFGISEIPVQEPLAGVRVGRVEGELVLNPTGEQLENSDLDLFVAASRTGILMVEAGAEEIQEAEMIEALLFAEKACISIVEMQEELFKGGQKEKMVIEPPVVDEDLYATFSKEAGPKVEAALKIKEKMARYEALSGVKEEMIEKLTKDADDADDVTSKLKGMMEQLTNETGRNITIKDGKRIDGRAYDEIRQITGEASFLPRTHGSALFTRGETQALATCTLGTSDDQQMIDTMAQNRKERFLLHYNFPPFCVGEAGRLGAPGRRELGHGNLARRSLLGQLPSLEEFEYTIRLVSEVLESNGSSSMATVCGSTMAMLDAGVPLKASVAGIAMGLVKEGNDVVVLSDILGDEDHFGDMDFKVCGTKKGLTALQMDIKIDGIDEPLLVKALEQAKNGRLHILGKMAEVIDAPKSELSKYAPVITSIKIKADKIKIVIGPGGKNIKNIIAETGCKVDVDESGKVNVASSDPEASAKALAMIKELVAEPEVGVTYDGTVKKIMPFGAFVEIMPRCEGLLHISEIDHKRIEKVEDVLKEGDAVQVVLLAIDRDGKFKLSRKALIPRK